MAIINIHLWRQYNFFRLSNVQNTSVNSYLPNSFLLLNMICLFLSLFSNSSFWLILLLCILSNLDNGYFYLEKRRGRTNLKTNLKMLNSV